MHTPLSVVVVEAFGAIRVVKCLGMILRSILHRSALPYSTLNYPETSMAHQRGYLIFVSADLRSTNIAEAYSFSHFLGDLCQIWTLL